MTRPCLCGCGASLVGRDPSIRFSSDACEARAERSESKTERLQREVRQLAHDLTVAKREVASERSRAILAEGKLPQILPVYGGSE